MEKGRLSAGYTIVELMIVFGVSAALLVSGLLLVNGQQQKAELTTSANEVKSMIDGIINTVSSGYYQNRGDFSCVANVAGPIINNTPKSQGTNNGCIFIGKAIQFGVASDPTKINVYSLAGLQYKNASGSEVVDKLADAMPTSISQGTTKNTSAPNTNIETRKLGYGLKVKKVEYNPGGVATANTVAFVSDFAAADTNNNLAGGSRTANLYIINTTLDTDSTQLFTNKVDQANFVGPGTISEATVCFSTGSNKNIVLRIGSNDRQLSTLMRIVETSDTSNPWGSACS